MVEDAVQTGQTAVHRGAKLDHAGIHELLEQCGIGLRGRIGQESVLGGSLVKEVAADDGRGELGRRQPQQIRRAGHTRLGMLTHEVFYIGASFDIGGQVLQKALGYHGGVGIALEKDDIRVDFARAERQRNHFHIGAGRRFQNGDVHIVALRGHAFFNCVHHGDGIGVIGRYVLDEDGYRNGCIRCADFGNGGGAHQHQGGGEKKREPFFHSGFLLD